VEMTRGMDICIATSARTDEEARALLEQVGFPFRK
jgi:large subunit ribosomal protein L5